MDRVTRKVLLITPDPTDADLIWKVLAEARDAPFDMRWVSKLSDGLEQLSKSGIDAILLKLSLAHGDGIEVFDKLFLAAPQIPILVLGVSDDEDVGRQAVQHGADDYLLKDYINRDYSLASISC